MRDSRAITVRLCVVAGLIVASRAPAVRAAEPLDMSYISADAIGAVVIHPRRLLTDPQLAMLPTEIVIAACQENFGFDPSEIETAIGILSLAGLSNGEPNFGLILRFQKPYDARTVRQLLGEGALEEAHAGQKYWKLATRGGPALCLAMPSDRTILLGTEPQLKKMLTARDVDSGLTKLLKKCDTSKAAVAVLDFAAVRPLVLLGMQSLPPLPPDFAQFLDVPKLVKSVRVELDLSPLAVGITLGANDAAAAGRLKDLADEGKKMALAFVDQEMSATLAGDDTPTARATVQYVRRLVRGFLDAIEIRAEADEVRVGFAGDIQSSMATTGMMVALLLPAVQAAREAARRAQSQNNLKQIGLALLNAENSRGRFPARAITDKEGKPLLSWRVAILPYVEEKELCDQFHLDEPWDSEHNRRLLDKMPSLYSNPNVPNRQNTVYLGVDGLGTIFGGDQGMRLAEIKDGTSRTILVVEADPDRAVPWTKPDDLRFDPERPLNGLGKLRPAGIMAVFADGSVQVIPKDVDPAVLKALMTAAGGEAEALHTR